MHIYVCIYIYMCVCMCVCVRVRVRVRVRVCVYMYIGSNRPDAMANGSASSAKHRRAPPGTKTQVKQHLWY